MDMNSTEFTFEALSIILIEFFFSGNMGFCKEANLVPPPFTNPSFLNESERTY
jgi:hypothetical protein